MATPALVPPCYDNGGNIVDCGDPSAVTDNAGNLTSQFLSSTAGQATALPTQGAVAVTPSQVGATAAGGSIFGSSALSSIFSGLGQVGVAAVSQAAGVTKPPTTTLFGTGTSASSSTGIMLLLAALVVAFFAFGGAKKLSS
jgi:hypothetical protein